MQRHFSIGSSTLAALMAAHREAASGPEANHTAFNPAGIAEMDRYLDNEFAPDIRITDHKAARA